MMYGKFASSRHFSLPEFAENILIAFNSLRTEGDHKTVNMFQKKPVNAFDRQSEEYKYQELVTPYAFTGGWSMPVTAVTVSPTWRTMILVKSNSLIC